MAVISLYVAFKLGDAIGLKLHPHSRALVEARKEDFAEYHAIYPGRRISPKLLFIPIIIVLAGIFSAPYISKPYIQVIHTYADNSMRQFNPYSQGYPSPYTNFRHGERTEIQSR